MGRAGSVPEFHVNSGSGRVGSLDLWVGLSRVRKLDPRPVVIGLMFGRKCMYDSLIVIGAI